MFILDGNRTQLINSDYIERISICETGDAAVVRIKLANDIVTAGRYADRKEAEAELIKLMESVEEGYTHKMSESTGCRTPEKRQHTFNGRKPARRGGS